MEIALATNFTDASDQVIRACYLRSLCIELFRNVIRQYHRVSLQVCTNFCFHRRQSRYNYMVYRFGTIGLIHINTIRCCFVLRRSIISCLCVKVLKLISFKGDKIKTNPAFKYQHIRPKFGDTRSLSTYF